MILVATVILLACALWRDAPWGAIACMLAGLAVQVMLVLRLARATVGGVGGHAEWVRERAVRPRVMRDPAWLAGAALVLAGLMWWLSAA